MHVVLDLDSVDRAVVVSGKITKKATVTLALKEFIARREQGRVTERFGQLAWGARYDGKAKRSRR